MYVVSQKYRTMRKSMLSTMNDSVRDASKCHLCREIPVIGELVHMLLPDDISERKTQLCDACLDKFGKAKVGVSLESKTVGAEFTSFFTNSVSAVLSRRLVLFYVDIDRALYWCAPGSLRILDEGNRLLLSRIIDVYLGKSRWNSVWKDKDNIDEDRCFSLMTSGWGIHLAADSHEARNNWLAALNDLFIKMNRTVRGDPPIRHAHSTDVHQYDDVMHTESVPLLGLHHRISKPS
jgi:hypothetical protein